MGWEGGAHSPGLSKLSRLVTLYVSSWAWALILTRRLLGVLLEVVPVVASTTVMITRKTDSFFWWLVNRSFLIVFLWAIAGGGGLNQCFWWPVDRLCCLQGWGLCCKSCCGNPWCLLLMVLFCFVMSVLQVVGCFW